MISTIKKNFVKIILILAGLFCFVSCAFLFLPTNTALANVTNSKIYSPSTTLENTSLSSPKDFCYWNGNLAVIEGQSVKIFFSDGTAREVSGNFTALKQIMVLSEDKLLVSNNGSIYTIDLSDFTVSPLTYLASGLVTNVGGNYFDFNGTYLITAYSSDLDVFEFDGQNFSLVHHEAEFLNGDEPIAINDNGDVFYVNGSTENNKKLCKRSVANFGHMDELVTGVDPSHVIADTTYVYYVSSGTINRIPVNGGASISLSTTDEGYNLGHLPTDKDITGIAFKDGKLLVSVAELNAIQEFKIENDGLIFTGYAIANDKTAYNRIKKDAIDIEQYDNALAVLDSEKLTVIKNTTITDYSKDNYYNLKLDSVMPTKPNAFTLGKNTVLLTNTSTKDVAVFNFDTGERVYFHTLPDGNHIIDVCYQNGAYYILELTTGSGVDACVYKLSESELSLSTMTFTATGHYGTNSLFTVDVEENVYITDSTRKNVYVFNKADGYAVPESPKYQNLPAVKKLATDLTLGLFALTDISVICYENDGFTEYDLDLLSIKSFSLSFDSKSVYFLQENNEVIYTTEELYNTSASRFNVPNDYRIKPDTVNVDKLKIFTVSSDAVLYNVTDCGKDYFNFIDTYNNYRNEYALISSFSYSENGRISSDFSLILGYDINNNPITLIVKTDELIEKTDAVSEINKTVYTTTGVSAYYMPVITEEDAYCMVNDNGLLRFDKHAKLTALGKLNFLDKDFLYVSAEIDGKTFYCYVPESFTVETLFVNSPTENFTDNASDGGKHLRNALILMLVATSVFATSIYFILKKKEK